MVDQRQPRSAAEWVGPEGSREDVSSHTDRALLLRAIHEVLVLRHDFGKLLAEVSGVQKRLNHVSRWSQDAEDEITLVKDLRRTVKQWRSRTIGAIIAVLVLVAASYVCAKLGIKVVG